MEFINGIFCVNYFMKIKVEFHYKLLRLDDSKVQLIVDTKPNNRIKVIGEFNTTKSNEEIKNYFKETYDLYQKDFDKAGFWKKSISISKFEKDIVDYLNE